MTEKPKPDASKEARKENTTSADPSKQESPAAPNTNKASDSKQGVPGTEDVNAPGINQKSTPGMDSDASSSTSLGTVTGRPESNEPVEDAAVRTTDTSGESSNAADATLNNSPDANHSFRDAVPGNDYYDPDKATPSADPAEYSEKRKSQMGAYNKLARIGESITSGTPDDHVLFGIGSVTFTVGDLKLLTEHGVYGQDDDS